MAKSVTAADRGARKPTGKETQVPGYSDAFRIQEPMKHRLGMGRGGRTPAMLLMLVVLMLGACTEESERIVGEGGGTNVDTLPVSNPTVLRRFGSLEDPDSGFTSVRDVVVDQDGLVYATDRDLRIRVYSPTGEFLRHIGRRGEGPGEFQSPPIFGVVGDSLWAFEIRNRRLTWFLRDGRVLSTTQVQSVEVPTAQPGMVGTVGPVQVRPDGLFLSSVQAWRQVGDGPPPATTDTVLSPLVLFDTSGQVVDTVGWYPAEEPPGEPGELTEIDGQFYNVPAPPSERPLRLLLSEGQIVVDRHVSTNPLGDTFSVTRLSFAEDTVYHRVFEYRPIGYSSALLDTIAWRNSTPAVYFEGSAPSDPSPTVAELIREAMRFPEHQLPVHAAVVGARGEVWLQREDQGGPDYNWLVLDSAGQARGIAQLPRDAQPKWVSRDQLFAATTDSLGVPWVVEFQLSSLGAEDD